MYFVRYIIKFRKICRSKKTLYKLRIPCLLVVVVLWILWIANLSINEKQWSGKQRKNSVPVIVAWTKYFSQSISGELLKTMDNCPYKCDLVERENMDPGKTPDAFIIHGRDLNVSDLPKRFPHQLVVLFLLEAPPYAGIDLHEAPPNYFNAMITYRKDATYYYPYGRFEKRDGSEDESRVINKEQLSAALVNKKKKALIFVSHCETHSKREALVRSISEVMKITTVGQCNDFFSNATRVHCPRYDNCEKDLIASHRFYLSFENSECKEYITEKFFARISQMLVPIVVRRTTYSAQDIPQDSFLAISDYPNLEYMARHIDFLMRNDSAYLEYFKWTKMYRKPNIFTNKVGCELCADIYAKKRMQIKDIGEYYFTNKCDPVWPHVDE